MTTAIDTNVLAALWTDEDALNLMAQKALDQARSHGGLVVSGAVYAELLAEPERNEEFVDRFFAEVGIAVEWEFSERIWRSAGEAVQKYAERRRKQKGAEPRRILRDFLIGAHALVSGYKLLTLDERTYRTAFPRLAIINV
jgi:predicted nucleic acid-binding protein